MSRAGGPGAWMPVGRQPKAADTGCKTPAPAVSRWQHRHVWWPSPHSLLTAQSTARHPSRGREGTEAALWEKSQAALIHGARGPTQSGHGLGCSQEVRGPWSLGVSDSQGRKALSTQDGLHVRAHEDSWGWPRHAHATAGGHCPGAELSPVLRGPPAPRGSKQILENAAEKTLGPGRAGRGPAQGGSLHSWPPPAARTRPPQRKDQDGRWQRPGPWKSSWSFLPSVPNTPAAMTSFQAAADCSPKPVFSTAPPPQQS